MSKEKKIDDSELSEVSGAGDPNAIIDLDVGDLDGGSAGSGGGSGTDSDGGGDTTGSDSRGDVSSGGTLEKRRGLGGPE